MSLASDKNRLFILAIIALLALVAIAYAAVPPVISKLVEWAYHSDAAPWRNLMRHRAVSGLGAYQAKALGLFRDALAIGLAALLALLWILWDRKEARFSLRALSLPAINPRNLAVVGTGALVLLSVRGELLYSLPLLVAAVTLFARESQTPFVRFGQVLNWLLQPKVSLPLVLLLAIATFFIKFPPGQFGQLIFFDDYPTIYTVTLKGWEILKQGGIFGWDPRLMGGYHTVSDVSHDEIFFMLPFLPLGPRVGFHLMIMFFYLLFPFLLYWYARLEFDRERPALLVLWIGLFTAFGFFDNLLYWGMVNSFIGLNLMLLNLILFALMRRGKPYADFFLILSLSLTLYAAGGFFAYSLLLLGLEFLRHLNWKMVPRLAFVMGATFLITLTFTYHFLRFPGYFVQSDEIYNPSHYSMTEIATQSTKALSRLADPRLWLLGKPIRYQGVFIVSIPILLSLAWSWVCGTRARRVDSTMPSLANTGVQISGMVIPVTLVMLVSLLVSPSVDMFVSRIRFVLPALLALSYGAWLCREEHIHPAPFLIVLTILLTTLPSRLLKPIPHVPSLRAYNAPLLDQIESLDSNLILLESMGGYNLATESSGSTQEAEMSVHLESLFPFETSKDYLANNQEGYHHSIYRRNFFTSGAFRGRLLSDWPMPEIKSFLDQWGIRYLVLWSHIATDYFGADTDFRRIWRDGSWAIYQYANAAPGDVVVDEGQGRINGRSYFEQVVELSQMRSGEQVTLRMNYFPAWRAYYGQEEIALLDENGLMGFAAPADGSYVITLRYPRYAELSLLALATIAAAFWLSWRYWRSQPGIAGDIRDKEQRL